MDFSKLNKIEFDDLIPGSKYYIEINEIEKKIFLEQANNTVY